MAQWVELDGSAGEGGGQILRTALSLSLITGTPFRIRKLRARRSKPGLAPQHLTAVRACVAISQGEAKGAALGSTDLTFTPGAVQPGNYRFDIGTAGATTLLAQTLIWPLAVQPKPSTLTLIGGTHVPNAPTFEYLSFGWAPIMRRLGLGVDLRMPRAGFYPQGGGELRVMLRGGAQFHHARWSIPVVFDAFTGVALQAGGDESIADRMAAAARTVLEAERIYMPMQAITVQARNPGMSIALVAGARQAPVCNTALGEKGKSPEALGKEAAEGLLKLMKARAPLDPQGADQVLIPLALARETSLVLTSWPTGHLRTNAQTIERFLPVRIYVQDEARGCALVQVEPQTAN